MSVLADDDKTIRRANRMRLDDLSADQLRDVAYYFNGVDPQTLNDVLNDLDGEWDQ